MTKSLQSPTFLCLILGMVLSFGLAEANAQTQLPSLETFRFFGSVDQSPRSLSLLRKSAIERFNILDVDGGGSFDTGDIRYSYQIAEAIQRSRLVAAWAKNDLNADGVVSRVELEVVLGPMSRRDLKGSGILIKPSPEQIRQTLDHLVGEVLSDDIDRDGILTLSEVLIAASAKYRRDSNLRFNPLEVLSFDADGDARVTLAEFESVLDSFLNW